MTAVIKIGGRVQEDPALAGALVEAASAWEGRLVVVHGGGDDISTLQRRLGHEPRFVGGRRSTTEEELGIVRMVLSGAANKRMVARILTAGGRAVGVSGEDGKLLTARVAPGAPLGRVGAEVRANPELLNDLLDAGWLPVVSPLARDMDDAAGAGLNVNGDDAAAAIAASVLADELVFVADVPGVLADGALVPSLNGVQAREMIASGTAGGGMAAKLEAALYALAHGVARVRIAGLTSLADSAGGTVLLPSPTVAPWPQ